MCALASSTMYSIHDAHISYPYTYNMSMVHRIIAASLGLSSSIDRHRLNAPSRNELSEDKIIRVTSFMVISMISPVLAHT